ncbi:MAG: electron transfer flavoprotein subunit beta/FixA family protein [Chlorobiaceae bacterium]
MHFAVCICQVPDTASVIGFVDGVIDRSRVNEVINPYDEYALEEALRQKELFGGSTVTVFCAGPPSAAEVLRKALAMGADRAFLVTAEPVDPWQTAHLLCRAILAVYSSHLPDLLFCGKHSTDFQSGQVPSMLAELLGIASFSGVISIEASGEGITLEREIEGGVESAFLPYPALISAEKGLNIPRKTSIKGVMEGRKKPLETLAISIEEPPFVILSGIEPLSRKKTCCFLQDETDLVELLGYKLALLQSSRKKRQ